MNVRELHYCEGDWLPFEAWMSFMVELGAILGLDRAGDRRLTVGVSLPTRGYAAVLAGVGAVLTQAEEIDPADSDAETYFEYLASLPEGTSVSWNNGHSKRPGFLLGARETPLGRRLWIQVSQSGGLREACTVEACLGIQVLDDTVTLPRGAGRGRPAAGRIPVLSRLLAGPAIFPFVSRTRLDCLMVGVASTLFEEASEELGVRDSGEGRFLSATISQLLRVRAATGPKDTFRSFICGTTSARPMQALVGADPGLVVFDGAQAFLRWRASWPTSPRLLILDRSEAHAADAAAALDQDRILYGAASEDRPDIAELPDLPEGVEIISYRARGQA